jgi:hypothetical protein
MPINRIGSPSLSSARRSPWDGRRLAGLRSLPFRLIMSLTLAPLWSASLANRVGQSAVLPFLVKWAS